CGVATRSRKALHEAGADRINNIREHDGYGTGRFQQCRNPYGPGGQYDVRRECDQFLRVPANAGGIASARTNVDPNVVAIGPTQLLHPLLKRPNAALRVQVIKVHAAADETADAPHALGLLRTRCEWPRSRTAKNCDELAPSHCLLRCSGHRTNL